MGTVHSPPTVMLGPLFPLGLAGLDGRQGFANNPSKKPARKFLNSATPSATPKLAPAVTTTVPPNPTKYERGVSRIPSPAVPASKTSETKYPTCAASPDSITKVVA